MPERSAISDQPSAQFDASKDEVGSDKRASLVDQYAQYWYDILKTNLPDFRGDFRTASLLMAHLQTAIDELFDKYQKKNLEGIKKPRLNLLRGTASSPIVTNTRGNAIFVEESFLTDYSKYDPEVKLTIARADGSISFVGLLTHFFELAGVEETHHSLFSQIKGLIKSGVIPDSVTIQAYDSQHHEKRALLAQLAYANRHSFPDETIGLLRKRLSESDSISKTEQSNERSFGALAKLDAIIQDKNVRRAQFLWLIKDNPNLPEELKDLSEGDFLLIIRAMRSGLAAARDCTIDDQKMGDMAIPKDIAWIRANYFGDQQASKIGYQPDHDWIGVTGLCVAELASAAKKGLGFPFDKLQGRVVLADDLAFLLMVEEATHRYDVKARGLATIDTSLDREHIAEQTASEVVQQAVDMFSISVF